MWSDAGTTTTAWLALAPPLAWVLDARFGELRSTCHPVAWLGRGLAPLGRTLCGWRPGLALAGGAFAWLSLAGLLGAAAWGVQEVLRTGSPWWSVPLLALLLKPMFAWRMLRDEVGAVEAALSQALSQARARLAGLVSRDTSELGPGQVREAAIETLAENLNDSVVAPLFWFALAGLPGAVVYRFANTADAMWGYHGRWEWAGKFAARADDVLSWVPARCTAWLLWPRPRWRALRMQAARTPSPNGGWPMAALALRLDIRLGKPGVYLIHREGRTPAAQDLAHALRLAGRAATAAMLAATVLAAARWSWT